MEFDLEEALRRFPLPDAIEDAEMNRTQLARALGVSENIITKYLDQGMPCATRGSNGTAYEFHPSECYAWKCWRDEDRRKRQEAGDRAAAQMALLFRNDDEVGEAEGAVLTADQILKESRADYERNRAAELRGELVRAGRVRELFEDVLIEFRTQIVSLVDFAELEFGLAPEQVAKMQKRCDGTLLQARQSFSRTVPGEVSRMSDHVPLDADAGDKAGHG